MTNLPGAFATVLALCVLLTIISMCVERWRKYRRRKELDEAVDELMRIGFLEADSRNWLEPYKTRLARFNKESV